MTLQAHDGVIRTGAALGAIAPRRQIAVAGKDRASYLQGLLTNDIQALTAGTGCYAAWLTPQGRMLTDMHVLESGTMILLDVPAEATDAIVARLDQFIFTEDVRVESLAESLSGVWLHGPLAGDVIGRAIGVSAGEGGRATVGAWANYQLAPFEFDGHPITVVRIDQIGVPGYCVYVERAHEPSLLTRLETAGAVVVLPAALEAARIEAGYPLFGIDMTDDTIPLEAGIEDRAISMSKGCYVGQEVIIRVLHRGHGRVARKLVNLRIDAVVPPRGTRLFAADRDVGFVTSAAASPRLGPIALAYVHRDFLAPGTTLEAAIDSGRVPATVTERVILSGA
jgi:folate-binding protein YgfZ